LVVANAGPVGAGLPANTGEAGAINHVACFAGKPAPTASVTLQKHKSPRSEAFVGGQTLNVRR